MKFEIKIPNKQVRVLEWSKYGGVMKIAVGHEISYRKLKQVWILDGSTGITREEYEKITQDEAREIQRLMGVPTKFHSRWRFWKK